MSDEYRPLGNLAFGDIYFKERDGCLEVSIDLAANAKTLNKADTMRLVDWLRWRLPCA